MVLEFGKYFYWFGLTSDNLWHISLLTTVSYQRRANAADLLGADLAHMALYGQARPSIVQRAEYLPAILSTLRYPHRCLADQRT